MADGEIKVLARNRKAFHDYEVLEKCEAGIELYGTEVKSIRAGHINLMDSYAMCENGEVVIHHLHIGPFEHANRFNHDPYRKRKLLLHRREIGRLSIEVDRKQLALIPLSVYMKNQWVKVELGLCKGRKKYDKRQKIAAEESKKRIAKIMKGISRALIAALVCYGVASSAVVFKTGGEGADTVPSELLSGSQYVSLPYVAQKLGYQWTWDRFAEKLACVNAFGRMIFTQDINFLVVNDSTYQLAAAPLRLGASLYLPAALAAEVFSQYGGKPVRWEPDSNAIVFSPRAAAAKASGPDTAGSGSAAQQAAPPTPLRNAVVKTEAKPRPDTIPSLEPSAPAFTPKTGAGVGTQKVRTVVIDPGHGGKDPGAIGPGGVQEKDVTLAIALQLRAILKHNSDLVVYLTRESDVFVPLRERTQFANEKKADIFISIHANSIAGNAKKREQAQGFKVYFLSQAKNEEDKLVAMKENSVIELEDRAGKGDNLKNILTDMAGNEYLSESQDMSIMIAEALGSQVADIPRLQQGVGQAPFWVLNGAFMPSVLIETAFISNPREEKLLVNPKVQKRIGLAVQSALSRFKTRYEEER